MLTVRPAALASASTRCTSARLRTHHAVDGLDLGLIEPRNIVALGPARRRLRVGPASGRPARPHRTLRVVIRSDCTNNSVTTSLCVGCASPLRVRKKDDRWVRW
eukprot:scaffold16589_cov69-Phaeocystis_antarctica.AAC.3